MPQQELLKRLAGVLESAEVAYMLTGSWASSIYGEPRSTHDVDIVIGCDAAAVVAIRNAFPAEQYAFDDVAARTAVRARSMFQVWQYETGDSADLWIVGEDDFSTSALARRTKHRILDFEVFVSSPEDLIIQKLRWALMSGGSEKQINDVRGVYELQFPRLDLEYIDRWVMELGLSALWTGVKQSAKPM